MRQKITPKGQWDTGLENIGLTYQPTIHVLDDSEVLSEQMKI